jgi:hypothetical protein
MGVQLRLFILYALAWNMLSGQGVRDEWRQLGSFDLEAHLSSSLANANLSDQERRQIYRLIDDKTIHDSFTDDQRDKERETVLSARVGLISLTDGQSEQIVVRGPDITCGHSWNCSMLILTRDKGGLNPILRTGGGAFIISKTSHLGFHDIATGLTRELTSLPRSRRGPRPGRSLQGGWRERPTPRAGAPPFMRALAANGICV